MLLLLLLIFVAVGDVAILAAAIVTVNYVLIVGATALDVLDAVNVEVAAMMVIDGEGCVRRLDEKLLASIISLIVMCYTIINRARYCYFRRNNINN